MMNGLKYLGKKEFEGIMIDGVAGGFRDDGRSILAKDIAEVHDMEMRRVNENINRLIDRDRITEGVHYINLYQGSSQIAVGDLEIKVANRTKNVFLLSERGYFSLIKYMDDDKSWEVHDKLVDNYFQLQEDVKQLEKDKKVLTEIAKSSKEQDERIYLANKQNYGWQNIRREIEDCDYRTIEDKVNEIINFHTEVLRKRDRADYPSHREANNTEYKQIVRERIFSILDDISNKTHDGVLRAVTGELRVNVVKDTLSTTRRSTSRLQSNLERKYEANREPEIDEYHTIELHALSENSLYESVIGFDGKAYTKRTQIHKIWENNFKDLTFTLPTRKQLEVDVSKDMVIYLAYDHMDKFDVTNLHKAIIDQIANHYGFDDVLIREISHKSNKIVSSYDEGKVHFLLANLDNRI